MSEEEKRNEEGTHVLPLNAGNVMDTIYNRFMAHFTPFGFQGSQDDVDFHPLPYKPEASDELLLKKPWRVILELYTEDRRMLMGLDLYGDVILGRGESHPGRIIIDLDPYDAHELGVSREHAMMRPTSSQLFVIDQGSTNGTTVNGVRSGRGVATALKHEDLLRLGNMVLMVHIAGKPGASAQPPKS